jgi:excisionase family DNA binding protein
MPVQPERPLLEIREAAVFLNVNEYTIRRFIQRGQIPALQLGDAKKGMTHADTSGDNVRRRNEASVGEENDC